MSSPIAIHWFRRDLRLEDNTALFHALQSGHPVLPLFIFDTNILSQLQNKQDARVQFIHQSLQLIQEELKRAGGNLLVMYGEPEAIWKELIQTHNILEVHTNGDYEPYALERDQQVNDLLKKKGIAFHVHKDHVVFEKDEVLKPDGTPYSVFTPYSKKWKERFVAEGLKFSPSEKLLKKNLFTVEAPFPSLEEIGFKPGKINVPDYSISASMLTDYKTKRDIPSLDATSHISTHLRFGTVSVRKIVEEVKDKSDAFLNEIIWREFYHMILFHYPHTATQSFKPDYDRIAWINDEVQFQKWCEGKTGYPMVDAGMRQLNQTGWMHNRVRMVVASFLTKHLLIDWRWGEAYFASKLLDYDMAANVGGWQWAAGCGNDAAPYFRVFNPTEQQKKFDPQFTYIRKWVPEFGTSDYPAPIIDHTFARKRVLEVYQKALKG